MAEAALAVVGDNSQHMTPFELSEAEILDLYGEAMNFLNGEPVATQAQCDAIQKLMSELRKAEKTAEARRVAENKPFDDGKKAVQEKYAPLISDTKSVKGKTVLAIEACKKAMQPFLLAEEAKLTAEKERIRREADAAAAIAQEAMRKARQTENNLIERERAEELLRAAKHAEADASRAEKAKATAQGGTGRASTLRTTYEAEIVDMREFARWCWEHQKPELNEFFTTRAKQLVGYGKRDIPGVRVN